MKRTLRHLLIRANYTGGEKTTTGNESVRTGKWKRATFHKGAHP